MAEYEIERVCPVCGKHFDVLYKELWAYKKTRYKGGYDFYCTWKCLRAAETNKTKKPEPVPEKRENKDRLAVLKDLMDALCDGRDAYDYLRDMGYTDPKDTLRKLRTTAKKENPELYKRMGKMGLLDMRKEHSGKGVDKMSQNKLTREQKGKAVDIAIQGGDPLAYLKLCGAKNPTAAWWYIKKTLATKNPQLLEKIPEKIGTVLNEKGQVAARVEIAEKLPPEAVAEVPEGDPLAGFVAYDPGAPEGDKTVLEKPEEATITGEEKEQLDELTRDGMPLDEAMEEVKERLKDARVKLGEKHKTIGDAFEELAQGLQTRLNPTKKPVNYDGFEVVCIRGEFGEYRMDGKKFHFANAAKIMYIEMYKEDLAAFLDEVRRAAQILGVDAG